MNNINRSWHEQNRMPKNATAQQRVEWHLGHAANCSCRPIPAGVLSLLAARAEQPPADSIDRKEADSSAQ
jgi:hypothetical protein